MNGNGKRNSKFSNNGYEDKSLDVENEDLLYQKTSRINNNFTKNHSHKKKGDKTTRNDHRYN